MMLRARGSVPPIVVDDPSDRTPSPKLPKKVAPFTSRPMMLPCTRVPEAPALMSIPLPKFREMTLPTPRPGVSVGPPIVLPDEVMVTPFWVLPKPISPLMSVPM